MKRRTAVAACLAAPALLLGAQARQGGRKLSPGQVDGRWGYWDETGARVIAPQFGWAEEFAEGLAPVAVGSKWGYVDQNGALRIRPRFDRAWQFAEGLAPVLLDRKLGYIDRTGRMIIAPHFDVPHRFWQFPHERLRSEQEYAQAVIDGTAYDPRNGFWLQVLCLFSGGLAVVRVKDKLGFIDRGGRLVIPPRFDEAEPFQEGRARVAVGGDSFCIDRAGKPIRPCR